jgi:hypothetical protein
MHVMQARKHGCAAEIDDFGARADVSADRRIIAYGDDHAALNRHRLGPAIGRMDLCIREDQVCIVGRRLRLRSHTHGD